MNKAFGALATLLFCLLIIAAHSRATALAPLPEYGWRGAPYIEHTQRAFALNLIQGMPPGERLSSLPQHLVALDGEHPALLHALSARVGAALGETGREPTITPFWGYLLAQGLGWIALLILGAHLSLRGLRGLSGAEEDPDATEDPETTKDRLLRASALTLGILACPGIFATARRYYFDLPMAAWLALFMGCLLLGYRRWPFLFGAGLALGLALLTKWHSVIYALWPLAFVLVVGLRRGEGLRAARVVLTVLFLGAALALGPWALEGSLPSSISRLMGEGGVVMERESGPVLGGILSLGLGGLWSMTGLGVMAALGAFAIINLRGAGDANISLYPLGLAFLGVVVLPPFLMLGALAPVSDPRFLIPLVMPLVLAVVFVARSWSLRWMVLAFFMVGTLQLIDVDATPRGLTRPPLGERGWSRPRSSSALHPDAYLKVMSTLCDDNHPRGVTALPIDPAVDQDKGLAWRWAVARRCPHLRVIVTDSPPWGITSPRSRERPGWERVLMSEELKVAVDIRPHPSAEAQPP